MLTHANAKINYFRLRCCLLTMRNFHQSLNLSSIDISKRSTAPVPWFKFPSKMTRVSNSHPFILGQRQCLSTLATRTNTTGQEDGSGGSNRNPWITSTAISLAGALLLELKDSKEKTKAGESSAISESISSISTAPTTSNSNEKLTGEDEKTVSMSNRRQVIQSAFGKVVKLAMKSVVGIRVNYLTEPDAFGNNISNRQGSGFIFREDGLIMTNAHVVRGQGQKGIDSINVRLFDGRIFPGQVEIIDAQSDVAIIRISQNDLPPLRLGNSDETRADELVAVVGSNAVVENFVVAGMVFNGKLSGNKQIDDHYKDLFSGLILTVANLLNGQSGSPLVNMDGEVIGLNCASSGSNIAISIASNHLKNIINLFANINAIEMSLGIRLDSLDEDTIKDLEQQNISNVNVGDLSGSLQVVKLRKGSFAHLSGFKEGDVIIDINKPSIALNASGIEISASAQTAQIEVIRREGKKWEKLQLTLRA